MELLGMVNRSHERKKKKKTLLSQSEYVISNSKQNKMMSNQEVNLKIFKI